MAGSIVATVFNLIFLSLLSLTSALPPSLPFSGPGTTTTSTPAGFPTTLFYDDFSGVSDGSLPPSNNWVVDTGTSYPGGPANWGTNEVESYTSSASNLAVSSGNLLIQPQNNGGWTSGRIETTPKHDFSCAAGKKLRIEGKLSLGSAAESSQMGIWPAFWSLGSDFRGNYNNWPAVGEIDILEALNGAGTAYHTIHCGTAVAGPCNESTGIGSSSPFNHGAWHTHAVEIDRSNPAGDWTAETISWFVDNTQTMSIDGARVGDEDAWSSLAHSPRFLLLNVAVGGQFPDAVAQATTPDASTEGGSGVAMEVEYVGVYST